jgi:hypothetical protein
LFIRLLRIFFPLHGISTKDANAGADLNSMKFEQNEYHRLEGASARKAAETLYATHAEN